MRCLGANARLDEIQAAVLRVKLPYLDQWNARSPGACHISIMSNYGGSSRPSRLFEPWATHVYYVYVVQVQERDAFRKASEQEGIATGIHYPTPIHLQPACSPYGYGRGMLPVTEAVTDHIVSLPMYPELTVRANTDGCQCRQKKYGIGSLSGQ